MAKLLPEQVFPYLAIGLAKYTEQEQTYPYPLELLYAQHHLSLVMLALYPTTVTEFFELCKKPIGEWWPSSSTLPTDIDKRFELLTPEGELSQQVVDYLIEYKLPEGSTLQDIQVIAENELMANIHRMARQAASYDPIAANRDYTAIRKYVITNPWTTHEKLHRQFRDLRHFKVEDVGELYQDSRSAGSALLYRRSDMPEACYWNCSVCGPLYRHNDRLGSIKPSACDQRCPGMQSWRPLDIWDNTLVLKRGIHLRTHIPGTAEIRLYSWLTDEVRPVRSALQQVVLWPGVDRYDLQLAFQNEVWAVDVKDYRDPFALGKHIKEDNQDCKESDLKWHKWFYVYPTYRERQRPDYQDCARRAAEQLPPDVDILSEKQFRMRVLAR